MSDQVQAFLEYIKQKNILSENAIDRANSAAEESKEQICTVITKLGLLTEEELVSLYSEYCDLPIAKKDMFPKDRKKILDLEDDFFSWANAVVIRENDQVIELATVDPLDSFAKNALNYLTGKKVTYLVSTRHDVMNYYKNRK